MTNDEIYTKINEYRNRMKEIMTSSTTFELNKEVVKCRQEIEALRKQCTHLNHNHEVAKHSGRCIYCGTKL